MGWNTTAVILNDGLDQIERDPDFGKNLAHAVLELNVKKPQYVRAGNHCNAVMLVEHHHADHMVLVLVGRNQGTVITEVSTGWQDPNPELTLLKALATKHGYQIRKKGT